jgi:hypothetical protein
LRCPCGFTVEYYPPSPKGNAGSDGAMMRRG